MTREERQKQLKLLRDYENAPGHTPAISMSIIVSLIEGMEDSISKNSRAMTYLTVVIALATLALALIGGLDLWLNFCR